MPYLMTLKQMDAPAGSISLTVTAYAIAQWAVAPDGGSLPRESADAFAVWLESAWDDFYEEGDEATVQQVLEGAVSDWCGGRTL